VGGHELRWTEGVVMHYEEVGGVFYHSVRDCLDSTFQCMLFPISSQSRLNTEYVLMCPL
jgi:hypothetical protein